MLHSAGSKRRSPTEFDRGSFWLSRSCWSPDGQRLVFTQRRVISLIGQYDLKSERTTLLTASRFPVAIPHWSPDGRWIAYFDLRRGRTHGENRGSRISIMLFDPETKKKERNSENEQPMSWTNHEKSSLFHVFMCAKASIP